MLEQQEQKKIIDYLEKKGYYVIKLIKTNKNGIPDLMVLWKWETFFIEVKQKTWKQSEIQKFRQKEIIELWYKSYCYYWYNDFILWKHI